MKKRLTSILLLLTLVSFAFGQNFQLELDQNKVGDNLLVKVYISKTSGEDFELGSSSFPFADLSGALDLASAAVVQPEESDFYPANSEAYSSLGVSATGNYVHLILLANTNNGSLNGTVVTDVKSKIATIQIPIINQCGTVGLSWLVNAGTALTNFSSQEITSTATYLGPKAYKLTEELLVPYIERQGDHLYVQVNSETFTWYKDGEEVASNAPLLENASEGLYEVIAENECEQKVSNSFRVETTTAIDESTGINYSLLAYPNPYYSKTTLQYEVKASSNVVLEVHDIIGNKIATLVSEQQGQGIYNVSFEAGKNSYESGTYIVSLDIGGTKLIQKIVELK